MSIKMKPDDPAYWMLSRKTPDISDDEAAFILGGMDHLVHSETCYICRDPEFAQMGLPLCFPCYKCGGHCAADNPVCDECGECQDDGPPDDYYEKEKEYE